MNFKRNCFPINILLTLVFALTSCGQDNAFARYEFLDEIQINEEPIENYNYERYSSYSNYVTKSGYDLGSASELMRNNDKKFLNTTGEQKLLVVPVDFSDYTVKNLGISDSEFFDTLNKVFFGQVKNNKYCSVSQYLNVSSYGKLKLGGDVVNDFYRFDKSAESLLKQSSNNQIQVSNYYNSVLKWCEEVKQINLDDYAIEGLSKEGQTVMNRKDVPIFLVYTIGANSQEKDSIFWAFTFQDVPLSWASFSFAYVENELPDSHTYIHEVSHLLGLVDYYPTLVDGKVNEIPEPTARIDMMDCSVGDHSAFSKMYLDWIKPYHVKSDKGCEITIKSFEKSGEVILLNKNWNKTAFDEYFLIEFYTPTGLNNYDCNIGNSQARLPNMPGIKIYHIDARLGYYNIDRSNKNFVAYCDESVTTKGNRVDFAHDNNTYSIGEIGLENQNKLRYLNTLILNNEQDMIAGCATNIHLFHKGDVITNLTYSNKSELGYKIEIKDIDYDEATIKISENI